MLKNNETVNKFSRFIRFLIKFHFPALDTVLSGPQSLLDEFGLAQSTLKHIAFYDIATVRRY